MSSIPNYGIITSGRRINAVRTMLIAVNTWSLVYMKIGGTPAKGCCSYDRKATLIELADCMKSVPRGMNKATKFRVPGMFSVQDLGHGDLKF